jgi:ATP-binding cassette, subfamily B, bacterial
MRTMIITATAATSPTPNLRALLPFLTPYRGRVVWAGVFLVLAALATLATPLILRQVIDQGFAPAIAKKDTSYLVATLFELGAAAIVMALAAGARFMVVSWLGERVVSDIRSAVYTRLLDQPPQYFETLKTGEVLSRLTTDTTLIQTLVGSSLSMGIRNALLVIGSIGMLFYTYPKTTALVLAMIGGVMAVITVFSRRVRKLSRSSQDRVADISSLAGEALNAVTTVQAHNQQGYEVKRFGMRVEAAFATAMRRTRLRALMMIFIMLAFAAALLFGLWLGGRGVIAGETTVGELTQFFIYAIMVGSGVGIMAEVWGDVQRAAGASERLVELLSAKPSIADAPQTVSVDPATPKTIRFEGIAFTYPARPDVPVLRGIDFTVNTGQRVALVGASGAGKTTVFALLQRFYEAQSGNVSIAGVPVNQLKLTDLRNLMSVVPQEPVVFSDSFANNIRYGKPDASLAQIKTAAQAAQLATFIDSLPDGYDTDLGERGVRLSGGQKQRLAIARAILRDAPILLLDEATAALDASSEAEVQKALDAAMTGRTVLVIAHRLATIQHCDTILVFEAGQIVQQGTHDTLMAQKGVYQTLASLQALH